MAASLPQIVLKIIDECRASDAPHECLKGHIDRLANDPDWTAADVEEVQARAKRILASVLNGPPRG